jgi:plastocyanin
METKMKTKMLGTLFILAIVLTACGSKAVSPAPAATSAPVASGSEFKINISSFQFDPATITIKAGEKVTWTNQDSVGHTVVADDNSWASDNLGKGASYSHTFDKAGTYTYRCGVHPSMKGTVIVQ